MATATTINRHGKESIDFYDVSEDQIMILESSQRDLTLEILWIGLGTAIGAFPSSLSAMWKYFSSEVGYVFPLDELAQVVVFFAAISASGVATKIYRKRAKTATSIFTEIRAQKKSDVSLTPDVANTYRVHALQQKRCAKFTAR